VVCMMCGLLTRFNLRPMQSLQVAWKRE
jgi:hypothetical protein